MAPYSNLDIHPSHVLVTCFDFLMARKLHCTYNLSLKWGKKKIGKMLISTTIYLRAMGRSAIKRNKIFSFMAPDY